MDLLQVLYYVLLAAYWILVISSVSVVLVVNRIGKDNCMDFGIDDGSFHWIIVLYCFWL